VGENAMAADEVEFNLVLRDTGQDKVSSYAI
jgi:hypothetical protein